MKGATFEPYEEGGAHVSIDTGNANTLRVRIRGKEAAMSALMTHDEARKMAHALIKMTDEKGDTFNIADTIKGPWQLMDDGTIDVEREDVVAGRGVQSLRLVICAGGLLSECLFLNAESAYMFGRAVATRAEGCITMPRESWEDEQC